ncbi:thiamine phosphate synthase [Campylobacter hepaticus]|uniref:Thiamine phosphate synthase n=1 Tax=Campylobacter hepaticus TaxID=1813019 RepID=A0A424Z224_9BACT|nr:thiamine phosphate synthase [Campylobacter hepaticus]AXP09513.1 thiamine phosphate synthase [Campylobacter hepaticus]MCZ0772296.1 thiamine phosphate synthase [Campylobacter hepaticus]MCZ0773764.1 thiamine phosphate synthase [Campylobacter hepaticus]MCZ0775015.1 thiamine phosphate synthase [Campylobacter hepaticus]MDX2322884.1 thiamine phosphate synthase [Campylobacter hepaticus]
MWDKKIIAISDRKCVQIDFLKYMEKLAKAKIDAIVLREKDLSEFEYYDLAKEVLAICAKHKITCFLHFFDRVCLKLGHRYFHAPLVLLRKEPKLARYFHVLGTSVHSKEELLEAINYKVNYAFVGHIFTSSCKKDLNPKGIDFLKSLLDFSPIPLYAIGGINIRNIEQFKSLNVAGVCMREILIQEKDLKKYLIACKEKLL